jgi:hypothetical protein
MKRKFYLILTIALSFINISIASAMDLQVFPSPDGRLTAKIIPSAKPPECIVEIYGEKGKVLVRIDYSSPDGEHGQYVEQASWTPDSKFFVYSTYNTGGHSEWQSKYFFYRRRDNKLLSSSDFLPPIVAAKFSLRAPDIITLTIWSPFKSDKGIQGSIKLPISFKLRDINENTIEE